MGLLSTLFGRRQRGDLTVVLYTRQGCCLCDDAWTLLEGFRADYGFHLNAIDIDENAELTPKFNECVPVVEVNGRIVSRGSLNGVLFRRILDAK